MRRLLFLLACLVTGLALPAVAAGVVTGRLAPVAAPAVLVAALALGLLLSLPAVVAGAGLYDPRIRVKGFGETAQQLRIAVAVARVAVWAGRRILLAEWLLVGRLTGRRIASLAR